MSTRQKLTLLLGIFVYYRPMFTEVPFPTMHKRNIF